LAERTTSNLNPEDAIRILGSFSDVEHLAASQLLPLVYTELRSLADRYLINERRDHTLQATALVHEAYIRLAESKPQGWQSRHHFFRVAAAAMRHILVDHARHKKRKKSGGDQKRLPLEDAFGAFEEKAIDLVALDEALEKLAQDDERAAKVVELRFFGGLTVEDTAEVLGVSARTVRTYWTTAKLWLFRSMKGH